MGFASKFKYRKKVYFGFPILIIIISCLLANSLFSETRLREYHFEHYYKEREKIVEAVLSEELQPDENGTINLPEEFRDDKVARGGRVYIVNYQSQMGIYFRTFTGLLESSAGYVYLTEDIFDIDSQEKIILQNQYWENWYYCGTD